MLNFTRTDLVAEFSPRMNLHIDRSPSSIFLAGNFKKKLKNVLSTSLYSTCVDQHFIKRKFITSLLALSYVYTYRLHHREIYIDEYNVFQTYSVH